MYDKQRTNNYYISNTEMDHTTIMKELEERLHGGDATGAGEACLALFRSGATIAHDETRVKSTSSLYRGCLRGPLSHSTNLRRGPREDNIVVFNSFLNVLAKAGWAHKAKERVLSLALLAPNEVTVGIVLNAYATQIQRSPRSPQIPSWQREAVAFLKTMKEDHGICENAVIVNSLLKVLNKAADLAGTLSYIKEVVAKMPACLDRSSFNTAINTCAKKGQIQHILRLCETMEAMAIEPDVVTYSSIIHGFAVTANLTGAKRTFSKMKERGISPNHVTFNSMIQACNNARDYDSAITYWKAMKEEGVLPNSGTFHCSSRRAATRGIQRGSIPPRGDEQPRHHP